MCVLFVKSALKSAGTLTPEKMREIALKAETRQATIRDLNAGAVVQKVETFLDHKAIRMWEQAA